jgi:integrase
MPQIKITKRSIDALRPAERPTIAFDEDLPGFGVRVMPSGLKTFVVEYRPNGGGRAVNKRRLTLGRYGPTTPEQARAAARKILAHVRLGADPAAENAAARHALTISALIDAFLAEHVALKCKKGTATSHKEALERLRSAHGSLKAEGLTRAQVAALHAKMRAIPFAANRCLAVISKLFNWANARGLVPEGSNPATRIERFPEHRRERFLSSLELGRLGDALREGETVGLTFDIDTTKPGAKHAPKPENRRRAIDPFAIAAIRLLILTGARLREILDLQWRHVDFERGMLHLADSKTGKKSIYLPPAALAILESLPRVEGNSFVICGSKADAPRSDLKKPWAAITAAAGLRGLRIHDLRHSFASVGAGASLGLPIIGKLLGHKQAATTHRYAHLDCDPLRRAVDTIGATISAAMDRPSAAEDGVVSLRLPLKTEGAKR